MFSGNQQRGNFPHTQFVNNNTLQSLDIFRRQNCSHLCDVLDPIHMNTFSFSMQGFDWESNPGHLMLDVILYGNCLLYGDERRREREPGGRGRERRWRKSDGLMLPLVAVEHQLTWFPGCYKGRKKQSNFHPYHRNNDMRNIWWYTLVLSQMKDVYVHSLRLWGYGELLKRC